MIRVRNEVVCSWLERSVILLAFIYLALHTLPGAWKKLNTDFPNYYMSARLVHEGYDTSQMYDWSWLEREKDHRAVDIRVIGLLPITPFSTLAMLPIARFAPLAAKHLWILLSLGLLIPIVYMLRSMTGQSYQRVALIFALSFPLHRNLEFGQYYIVLLFLIVAACWAYLRSWHAAAGILVAVATACKIFPVLLLVFFIRRRGWRALSWSLGAVALCTGISVAVFGWGVHRTYLQEILPWTMHGGAMPPYVASASISGVLHRLFLLEPQWNRHPWHSSPLCFALLMPALQMLVLAPAILLIRSGQKGRDRVLLEVSGLLTAALAISTVPALYNFVLLALPVCVMTGILWRSQRYVRLLMVLVAYVLIGLPFPNPDKMIGPSGLLLLIRLPLLLSLLFGIYRMLWHGKIEERTVESRTSWIWAAAMIAITVTSALSAYRREQSMRTEYPFRVPLYAQGFLNAHPRPMAGGVRYIAFTYGGYHMVSEEAGITNTDAEHTSPDELSFTTRSGADPQNGVILVERATSPQSQIVDLAHDAKRIVNNAREPMLSVDGQSLAFIRDDHGRGRLMERAFLAQEDAREILLTNPTLNVYEASLRSRDEYAYSAVENGLPPTIYLNDATHRNSALALGETRYPAISPDGRWMAYSRFEGGAWNLWLRDQLTGATSRVADVACNQIQPAWKADSKTLLYSSDCGRSIWFTAISQRKVVP